MTDAELDKIAESVVQNLIDVGIVLVQRTDVEHVVNDMGFLFFDTEHPVLKRLKESLEALGKLGEH